MSFFKTLLADLRERQILPAVVVLAALAIAIPIGAPKLFGGVSAPAPGSTAVPQVQLPTGVTSPQQELADLSTTPSPQAVLRHGAEPDPFRVAGASGKAAVASGSVAKKSTTSTSTTTTTTTTPVTTTPKPTTKPSTGASGATGSSGATGTPVTGPATLKSDQAYSVDIDTKDATGVHTLSDVVRLAPLPAADSPEVIFLGVLKGGQKAAFLFTNAIAVSSKPGNGLTCLPSTSACQIIELSPGQGLSLYPTANTALISTFSFELVSIGATTYASDGDANQARNAVSTAGQTLLPLSNSSELSTLSFESKIGALVHHTAPSGSHGGSTGSTGATGSTGSSGSTAGTGGTGGVESQATAVFFAAR
jgi:cell division septation protein DedD